MAGGVPGRVLTHPCVYTAGKQSQAGSAVRAAVPVRAAAARLCFRVMGCEAGAGVAMGRAQEGPPRPATARVVSPRPFRGCLAPSSRDVAARQISNQSASSHLPRVTLVTRGVVCALHCHPCVAWVGVRATCELEEREVAASGWANGLGPWGRARLIAGVSRPASLLAAHPARLAWRGPLSKAQQPLFQVLRRGMMATTMWGYVL